MLFGFTLGLFLWWVFISWAIDRRFQYRRAKIKRRVRRRTFAECRMPRS
jgi:hypothetical protein